MPAIELLRLYSIGAIIWKKLIRRQNTTPFQCAISSNVTRHHAMGVEGPPLFVAIREAMITMQNGTSGILRRLLAMPRQPPRRRHGLAFTHKPHAGYNGLPIIDYSTKFLQPALRNTT